MGHCFRACSGMSLARSSTDAPFSSVSEGFTNNVISMRTKIKQDNVVGWGGPSLP